MSFENINRKQKEHFIEAETQLMSLGDKLMAEKKANLPEHLEKRLKDLSAELATQGDDVSPLQIYEWMKAPITSNTPKYTADELAIIFDYYTKTIAEINKTTKYPPTKPNFCMFCGITTQTFDKYLNGGDIRKKQVAEQIDQYLRDMHLTLGETGKLNPIVAMYRTKSEHGMYEAQPPKVLQVESDVDIDKIKEQLLAVKNGVPLKQGKDGVFRSEEKMEGANEFNNTHTKRAQK